MRGIMDFDDYNYDRFNDYVLLEEPKFSYERAKLMDDRKNIDSKAAGEEERSQPSGTAGQPITEATLDKNPRANEEFSHDALTIEQSEYEKQKVTA